MGGACTACAGCDQVNNGEMHVDWACNSWWLFHTSDPAPYCSNDQQQQQQCDAICSSTCQDVLNAQIT